MPIPFSCPHCGARTEVSEEFAGQSGPCSQCGRPITVPPLGPLPVFAAPARGSGTTWLIILAAALPVLLLVGIAVIGILIALSVPATQAAREAARRARCTNNLCQIGIAMHEYENRYGCFPPAYVPDENGRPKHSWRVLLLPYLGEQALYDMYNFDEPWDSRNNLTLADMMPDVYRCPSEVSGPGQSTPSYAMIVGPGTISDGPTPTKLSQIRDGPSETVMLVEGAWPAANWLDPTDCDMEEGNLSINDVLGARSNHPGGVNVLLCDGSVRQIDEWVDPEVLDAWTTIAGGEDVRPPGSDD